MADCTFVYVLRECNAPAGRKPHTYVGWSVDVLARLDKHNAGKGAKRTRGRHWEIVYIEKFQTFSQAMKREWYLKRDRKFRRLLVDAMA